MQQGENFQEKKNQTQKEIFHLLLLNTVSIFLLSFKICCYYKLIHP